MPGKCFFFALSCPESGRSVSMVRPVAPAPPAPEVAMKSDWLPEAMLAVAFAVALFSQSARLFP